MDAWRLVHDYRRAVAEGKALPILCPDDEAELVPMVHPKKDDPVLKCLSCKTIFHIGQDVYDQMKAALSD